MPDLRNITTIFIDDGDVMNDNEVRAPQWSALLGDFFVPRLGGDAEAWQSANQVVFEAQWDEVAAGHGDMPFMEWWNRRQLLWMRGMAERTVGVADTTDDDWVRLAREASEFVTHRVSSAYPGAVNAIAALSDRGFSLHTASNEVSWELNGYLTGMGVRDLFGTLYGPDLVDADKHDDNYYPRLFQDSGVNPTEALVIDNSAEFLARAASAGAKTCLVTTTGIADEISVDISISALSQLPGVLAHPGR